MRWNNKRKTFGEFIIDLTPLLDVVFILLIVVLCFQENYSMDADARYEEAVQLEQDVITEKEKIEGINATLQEQLETYEQILKYENVVAIYASPMPDDRTHRILHVEVNSNEPQTWEIKPGREEQVWLECKNYIESTLSDRTELYTIIKVANEKMLYRDYEKIRNEFFESLNIKYKLLTDCMEFNDE